MRSKVSSDWLPSYSKATRPVLEIFKMARLLPGQPSCVCVCVCIYIYKRNTKYDVNLPPIEFFNHRLDYRSENMTRKLILTAENENNEYAVCQTLCSIM